MKRKGKQRVDTVTELLLRPTRRILSGSCSFVSIRGSTIASMRLRVISVNKFTETRLGG
jgi:hypothetical protein